MRSPSTRVASLVLLLLFSSLLLASASSSSSSTSPPPVCASAPLAALRALMRNASLHAYLVPTEDAHQSEYVAECDKRRQFLTGFTGSAGVAVVTPTAAALWTDGRYHTQVCARLYCIRLFSVIMQIIYLIKHDIRSSLFLIYCTCFVQYSRVCLYCKNWLQAERELDF